MLSDISVHERCQQWRSTTHMVINGAQTDAKTEAMQATRQTLPLDENEAMEFQPYGNSLFIFIYFFLLCQRSTLADVCLHNPIFFHSHLRFFLCTSRNGSSRCNVVVVLCKVTKRDDVVMFSQAVKIWMSFHTLVNFIWLKICKRWRWLNVKMSESRRTRALGIWVKRSIDLKAFRSNWVLCERRKK